MEVKKRKSAEKLTERVVIRYCQKCDWNTRSHQPERLLGHLTDAFQHSEGLSAELKDITIGRVGV